MNAEKLNNLKQYHAAELRVCALRGDSRQARLHARQLNRFDYLENLQSQQGWFNKDAYDFCRQKALNEEMSKMAKPDRRIRSMDSTTLVRVNNTHRFRSTDCGW